MTQMSQVPANAITRAPDGGCSKPRRQRANARGTRAGAGRQDNAAGKFRVTFPWINGQIIAAAETEDVGHLLATINMHLEHMNLVNLSTALHRLAKLAGSDCGNSCQVQNTLPPVLDAVRHSLTRFEVNGSQPKCQALSNISWALATMKVVDVPLLALVATYARNQLADFKNFELCQLLWAFAKLGTLDPELNEYIVELLVLAAGFVTEHIEQFSFRGLVMAAWAYATAKQHDSKLFCVIANQLLPNVHRANCQELANTAWSFSTAGVHDQRLFASLAFVATPRVHEFKAQELSSILWSFASIGFQHDDFYEAAGTAALGFQLQEQQLANILWALTKMRPRHQSTQAVLLQLLPRCTRLVRTFKPQELASVALAAGKGFGDCPLTSSKQVPPQVDGFFQASILWVMPNLQAYSGQSLANIASSFLAVQIGAEAGLFSAIANEISIRAEGLENSALLLLLKTLPQAPRSADVNSALCLLFAEAARRVDTLPFRELQVLARTCVRPLGAAEVGARDGSLESRHEVRASCEKLSRMWQSGDMGDVYRAEAEQAAAMSSDDEPSSARENGEARLEQDKAAQHTHYVFSVKNTFLEVAAGADVGELRTEEEPEPPLPPALPFLPDSVSTEKLQAYRTNYARFRVGNAIGAKGEVVTVSEEVAASSSEDEPNSAREDEEVRPEHDQTSVADQWAAPLTFSVAPTKGRPASLWDEEATQQLREAVETSVAHREDAVHDEDSVEDKAAQHTHYVFSVKNTFLEVEEDDDAGDLGTEEEPEPPLPPALPFIPDSVSAEKLQAYRTNYARFRVGNAIGAKGEVVTVS